MKSLLFFVMVSLFTLNYGMELMILEEPQLVWREQFNKLDREVYNKPVGYNLDLRLYRDNRPNVIHKFPSLLAHGFAASPYTMLEYARIISPYKIPGDLFIFSFADAYRNCLFFTKSNFAQVNDIKPLLMAIKCLYDSKVSGCNLFGQSRGAGTIVNTLAVLNTEVETWSNEFKDIKPFYKDRVAILDMIKKGVVVLDTPMVKLSTAVTAIRSNITYQDIFDSFIEQTLLPMVSNYLSDKMQVLDCVDNLPEGLKLLVSYQKNDKIVGNKHDKEFTKKLIDRFGKENVCVVLGSDSGKEIDGETWQVLEKAVKDKEIQSRFGMCLPYRHLFAHNAGYFILLKRGVLNKFFQKHLTSYFDDKKHLDEGDTILKKSETELYDYEKFFSNYDMHNY